MAVAKCPTCDILVNPTPANLCPRCNTSLSKAETWNPRDQGDVFGTGTVSTGHAARLAREIAQNDGTRGMIIVRLKQEGLSDQQAAEAADQALSATTTKNRGKGLIHVIAGVAILGIGILIFAQYAAADQPPSRTAMRIGVGALMVGGIEFLHGLVRMVTGMGAES